MYQGDVWGLEFDRTYHYRFVVGDTPGEDRTITVPIQPLHMRAFVRRELVLSTRRFNVYRLFVVFNARDAVASLSYCRHPRAPRQRLERCTLLRRMRVDSDRQTLYRGRLTLLRRHEGEAVVRIALPDGRAVFTYVQAESRGEPSISSICGAPLLGALVEATCVSVEPRISGHTLHQIGVHRAPPHARAEIVCAGRGCPFRVRSSTDVWKSWITPNFDNVRPGGSIDVYVTHPDAIGLRRRFRVTRTGVRRGEYECVARGTPRTIIPCP